MHQNRFWNLLAKKLSGEASIEEIEELETFIKTYPELSYSAQNITDLWQLRAKKNGHVAEEAFEKHAGLINSTSFAPPVQSGIADEMMPGKKNKRLMVVLAAVILLCAVAGGWAIFSSTSAPVQKQIAQNAEISTRAGSRSKLILPDSSVVWLNAGSRLTYGRDFGITNRATTLTGEAFFEVKKSNIPFTIHANTVNIKVLGTAFNVKSYPNENTTETSLIRGQVEITLDKRPGEKFILKPNEKLVVANAAPEAAKEEKKQPIVVLKELTQLSENTILETSWVENKLVFHDESFEEVARKMERWYNVNIDIRDERLSKLHVGGGPFENETIEQALSALQIAFDFKFNANGNQITITR